jgi:hypothetical protein
LIRGTFEDTFGGTEPRDISFTGVVFQKQQEGSGFFLSPTQGAARSIYPRRIDSN